MPSRMPKPTLSPSKITTYLACPVRYRWTYLDPKGRWYVRARATYSFGATLHHVLQTFHERGAVDSLDAVLASYEENWLDAGYTSAEEMAEAFGEGKEILEVYIDEVQRTPATAQTLFVERTLKRDMGAFVLVGRLDRVDQAPDGGLEIVDYKTGGSNLQDVDAANSVPLACYALLLEARYPGAPLRATLVGLRSGVRVSATFDVATLARFAADLNALAEQILDPAQDPEPRPKRLCASCDFLPLCRRDPRWQEPSRLDSKTPEAPPRPLP